MSTIYEGRTPSVSRTIEHNGQDAYRDVLVAVQRALVANWADDQPRIAVIERHGVAAVYVSTTEVLGPTTRIDVRSAVRAALAPYAALAPFTNVVFLHRTAS